MRLLFLIFFVFSCAHQNPPQSREEDLVTVRTALMQAQASYLKGCVDAMKDLKIPLAFHGCRDKSIIHRQELDQFMLTD